MPECVHPLSATAARVSAGHGWLRITHGSVTDGSWLRCSEVDATAVAQWEAAMTARHEAYYGRAHAAASASFVLGWYADVAGHVGALFFLLDRRVPRLDREALAFHLHPEFHYPDAIATLGETFWCLPSDPAADHPDARVLAGEQALAAQLRAEVRGHADDFLAAYLPGVRLPRRSLLGAFFDGLDSGFWLDDEALVPRREIVAAASLALPGSTGEFQQPTTYHSVVDGDGREQLTRRRMSCCYYFKLNDDGETCLTCPRTSGPERAHRP
jgi:hypothetical protein